MSIKGNVIGTTSPRADWAEQDPTKASYIRNKPNDILEFFTEEDIEKITAKAENAHRLEYMMAPSSAVTFQYTTARNVSLISCRGSQGSGHAVVLYNGYGSGGANRSSATILMGGGMVLCAVLPEGTGHGVTIWNDANVSCSVCVLELLGDLPSAIEGAVTSTKPANTNNTLVDRTYASQNYAPAGFGLNNNFKVTANIADVDGSLTNGWYKYANNAEVTLVPGFVVYYAVIRVDSYSTGTVVQTVYPVAYPGCVLQRYYRNSIWSEFEWINPPMATGVEYRTTERYKGVAVYKKVDTEGNILWRKDGETKWRLLSAASYVATATVE